MPQTLGTTCKVLQVASVLCFLLAYLNVLETIYNTPMSPLMKPLRAPVVLHFFPPWHP